LNSKFCNYSGITPTMSPLAAMRKLQFLTNILLYLGNDTRQGCRYRGMPIGSRMQSIKWCYEGRSINKLQNGIILLIFKM